MKKLTVFDKITTPESWKKAALDNISYEKPKLKTWQSGAVIAVTAAAAALLIIMPSLIIRTKPQTDRISAGDEEEISTAAEESSLAEVDPALLPKTEEKIEGSSLESEKREAVVKKMNQTCDVVLRCIVLDSFDGSSEGTEPYIKVVNMNQFSVFNKNQLKSFVLRKDGIDYTGALMRGDLTGNIDKDFGDEVLIGMDFEPDGSIYQVKAYMNLGPNTNSYFAGAYESALAVEATGLTGLDAKAITASIYTEDGINVGSPEERCYSYDHMNGDMDIAAYTLPGTQLVGEEYPDGDYVAAGVVKLESSSGVKLTPTLSDVNITSDEKSNTRVARTQLDLGSGGSVEVRIATDDFLCRTERIEAVKRDDTVYLIILCGCDPEADVSAGVNGAIDVTLNITDTDGDTEECYGVIYFTDGDYSYNVYQADYIYGDRELPDFDVDLDQTFVVDHSVSVYGRKIYTNSIRCALEISREDGTPLPDYEDTMFDETTGRYISDSEHYLYYRGTSDEDIPQWEKYCNELHVYKDYDREKKVVIAIKNSPDGEFMCYSDGYGSTEGKMRYGFSLSTNGIKYPEFVVWECDWDIDLTKLPFPAALDDPESEFYCPDKITLTFGGKYTVSEDQEAVRYF